MVAARRNCHSDHDSGGRCRVQFVIALGVQCGIRRGDDGDGHGGGDSTHDSGDDAGR